MNKLTTKYLVSIIIPTYNHAEYLKEAIDSVITQTYSNWELIIVNNFSSDNTIAVVESYKDERIKLINFSNNGIIAASRNIGLKNVKGEFIAFLDSDDIWLPNKIEKQLKELLKSKKIMLCSTNCDQFPYGQKNLLKIWFNKDINVNQLILRNDIINSSVIFRKTVFDKLGFLDETQGLRAVEDYDYWLRIVLFYPKSIRILRDRLILYRLHDSNVTGNTEQDIREKYKKIRIIHEKYYDIIGNKKEKLQKKLNEIESEEIARFEYYNKRNIRNLLNNRSIKKNKRVFIVIKGIIRKIWV